MTIEELNAGLLACRKCPRLVEWRERVAREKRRAYRDYDYWGKPVPGFGDLQARVFLVGLAPGAHGSNRTGRQFTGDSSGNFLFPALFRAGFASQPTSTTRQDGLYLTDLYTAPLCRCAPPGNKPTAQEKKNCLPYLKVELDSIQPQVIVALGRIAFDGILPLISPPGSHFSFAHNAIHKLSSGAWLVCSYHPSRQNTQTGRLTIEMFDQVWETVRGLIDK
jgi:uracil-DNA glycosylase family 4